MPSPWTRCSIRQATWASPHAFVMCQAYDTVSLFLEPCRAAHRAVPAAYCHGRPAPHLTPGALPLCLVHLSSVPGASSVGHVDIHTCLT